jgi:hypothetical protein
MEQRWNSNGTLLPKACYYYLFRGVLPQMEKQLTPNGDVLPQVEKHLSLNEDTKFSIEINL